MDLYLALPGINLRSPAQVINHLGGAAEDRRVRGLEGLCCY